MESAEEERGKNDPQSGLQRPPEKGLLTHAGEDRDQNEASPTGVVHQARGELIGELAQRRQPVVEKGAGPPKAKALRPSRALKTTPAKKSAV